MIEQRLRLTNVVVMTFLSGGVYASERKGLCMSLRFLGTS